MAARTRSAATTVEITLDGDPVRAAFQRRSLEALGRIVATAPVESPAEALAAPTDVGALARALGDDEVVGAAIVALEPLAPLIARNAEHRLQVLEAAGGTLAAPEAALLLGVSRQAVDKRRRANGLLSVRQGGDWRYPRCQFDEARRDIVAGLPTFLAEIGIENPWATPTAGLPNAAETPRALR